MNPQIREAAEEVAKIISVFPGTSSEHGEVAGKVVNLIASHIALAERRGGEAAMEYVRKYIYEYSDKDLELYRAACEGMGEEHGKE